MIQGRRRRRGRRRRGSRGKKANDANLTYNTTSHYGIPRNLNFSF
jgi:hypothetical protein